MLITESGKCLVFGDNTDGQLGLGHDNPLTIPVELRIFGQTIVFISYGRYHTSVLTKSNKCFIFGASSAFGQLGSEHEIDVTIPQELYIQNEIITFVTCGDNITAILTKSEKCFVFGDNTISQVGYNHRGMIITPIELNIDDEIITFITFGRGHTIILTKSQKCFVIGSNRFGQLGLDSYQKVKVPTELSIPSTNKTLGSTEREIIVSAICGPDNTFLLTKSYKCFVFGYNNYELGLGTWHNIKIPTELRIPKFNTVSSSGQEDITFITYKSHYGVILTKSGKCFYFGSNRLADLDNSTKIPTELRILKGDNKCSQEIIVSASCQESNILVLTKSGRCFSFESSSLFDSEPYEPTEIKVGEKILRFGIYKSAGLKWEIQRLFWIARKNEMGPFSRLPPDMINEIVKCY